MVRVLTRRAMVTGLATAGLAACATTPGNAAEAYARRLIDALVARGVVPAAGLVVCRGGEAVFSHAAGLAQGAAGEAPPLALTPASRMRIASVSKLAVALAAHRLAAAGAANLDADIAGHFDPPLTNPEHPGVPVTLRQLLSHTSGLQDPEVYWMAAPGRTEDLFTPTLWRAGAAGRPGAGFKYCNFAYGLAAHILERLTGERFDRLARRTVFAPLGLGCGFNWSGVDAASRRAGATLYTGAAGGWQITADGPDVRASDAPAVLKEQTFELADYVPGTNGTLFSPQGGLRASLEDMCILARAAAGESGLRVPVWRHVAGHAEDDTDGGYFYAFSAGAQIHPPTDSPLPGHEIIGHHGEAYGLYSGAFHAPRLKAEFAFAVTGTDTRGSTRSLFHPVAVEATAPLWEAVRRILARP